jgi:uroporphyrin-III C-methyltransferase / precorrin-2 dehydrogenase / sirohydrochlorin ferrochelatase
MQHFPIFLAVAGRRIVVSGGGETALAKLRLLRKTEAHLTVIAADPDADVLRMAALGEVRLIQRAMEPGDALCASLFYAANDDDAEDARVARLAQADGALTNLVDNLHDSQFITPAIVDRDPVVIAIGTEGAAPVLARQIKSDLEERLPAALGLLARIGKSFRRAADALPMGAKRRDFWADYYTTTGPQTLAQGGVEALEPALVALLTKHLTAPAKEGSVDLVGAGPGDPDLLTLKARKAIEAADVVIYDRLVSPQILELARREATLLDAGKEGFGSAMAQSDINDLITTHAKAGAHVVRLKSGDPTVFGRLDEEIDACEAAGVTWRIIPGITTASAAVAAMGQSLTKRGRNSAVRLLTGHDTKGFADHDWQALARPGSVAAIYMGKKSARFIQGRLLMHGADPLTPVTVMENVSRADQRVLATTLSRLEPTLTEANLTGPAIVFLGLAPRDASSISGTIAATLPPQEIAL